ncbi:arabinogalactan protein, putative [Babesia caballi]|uniref:Arabinogalactan protein, putative n=1 Tax=Babesia caballi TaxID=5871 RepID=A0AAV4LZG1_BABCB|nr:arabinogalactan protein, putative [Babesia caballi]
MSTPVSFALSRLQCVAEQLIPHCEQGEFLLMYRRDTSFEVTVDWRCLSAAGALTRRRSMKGVGDTFLTTHRIVFVKKRDKRFSQAFSSISLPYSHVDDPRFRQPIFGSNYLEGSIRPLLTAENPLRNTGKFYIYFNGGCGMFLQGFFMYYARVRNNPAFTASAHPFANAPEARSAFVDPNDPTQVYLSQPVEAAVDGAAGGGSASAATEQSAQRNREGATNNPGAMGPASQAAKGGMTAVPFLF